MRIIVCGPVGWDNRAFVWEVLDELHARHGIDCVIEGEARGVDTFAREWALDRGVPHEPYKANWSLQHRAAGPIRNKRMIVEGKPERVIAIARDWEDRGTANMRKQAEKAGLLVTRYAP